MKKVLPGAAERIFAMAEKEGDHRRKLENEMQRADGLETQVGQLFAFLFAIGSMSIGAYTAVQGAPGAGTFISATALVTIVTVFIRGRTR